MSMHDSMRAKVLGELMGHMISMHGKGGHAAQPEATLPHADGTPKHEPMGKLEGIATLKAHPIEDEMHNGVHSPEDIEDEHEKEGEPSDLFGRKKGKKEIF